MRQGGREGGREAGESVRQAGRQGGRCVRQGTLDIVQGAGLDSCYWRLICVNFNLSKEAAAGLPTTDMEVAGQQWRKGGLAEIGASTWGAGGKSRHSYGIVVLPPASRRSAGERRRLCISWCSCSAGRLKNA